MGEKRKGTEEEKKRIKKPTGLRLFIEDSVGPEQTLSNTATYNQIT